MVRGRRAEQWDHTSQMLAMQFNANATKVSEMMQPHEFNPYAEAPPDPVVGVDFLKDIYIKKDE